MTTFTKPFYLLMIAWLPLSIKPVYAVEIAVLTESTPFTTIEGEHTGGEATEFVAHILNQAGVDHQISYIPWKRAYQKALNEPNVLIYPIAKTEDREANFHWVGKITPVRYYLFGLRDRTDIILANLNAAKAYSVGVVNKHAHHEYLSSHGFSQDQFELVNSSAQNLKKVLLGRVDLFPLSGSGLSPLCADINVDCSRIVPKLKLDDFSDGLYMAFSQGSDPNIIEAVRAAYKESAQGTAYQAINKLRGDDAALIERDYQQLIQSQQTP